MATFIIRPTERMKEHQIILVTAAALGWTQPMMTIQPRRDVCVKCGAKIPPGRPGRSCKKCREEEQMNKCPICEQPIEGVPGAKVYHMICLEERLRPVREQLAAETARLKALQQRR